MAEQTAAQGQNFDDDHSDDSDDNEEEPSEEAPQLGEQEWERLTSADAPRPPTDEASQAQYERLYRTCWRQAADLAARLVGDHSLAEDVAQQAFLGVWCHWSTVQALPERAQAAYALRATRNAATDALRHRSGHPGGQPRSLYAPLHGPQQSANSGGAGEELTYANVFVDPSPDNDPERSLLGREALDALLAESGAGDLRRLEVLLTAQGYGSREVAEMMRVAAGWAPADPHVEQYRRATMSSIKMRRSRRRAAHRESLEQQESDDD